ncbi:MAG: hypothetical protein HPY50_04700 [Firmicutes bacterium]|nr:hypothetical protein [Bacillota bacterium]
MVLDQPVNERKRPTWSIDIPRLGMPEEYLPGRGLTDLTERNISFGLQKDSKPTVEMPELYGMYGNIRGKGLTKVWEETGLTPGSATPLGLHNYKQNEPGYSIAAAYMAGPDGSRANKKIQKEKIPKIEGGTTSFMERSGLDSSKSKHRKYLVMVTILFCMLSLVLCSCKKQPASNQSTTAEVHQVKNEVSSGQEENDAVDIEKLKAALKQNINDDIWYYGKYSDFYNWQNRRLKFELYRNNAYPCFEIFFDVSFSSKPNYTKYGVGFGRFKDGFGSWFPTRNPGPDDEINSMISHYIFIDNGEITIPSATKPEYPPAEQLAEKYEAVTEVVKRELGEQKGVYTLFIRGFRDTDSETEILLEDQDKRIFYMRLFFLEDGSVKPFKFVNFCDDDRNRYFAKRLKETRVKKTVIIQ